VAAESRTVRLSGCSYEIRPADEGWFSHDTGTFIPRHIKGEDTLHTKQGQGEGLVAYCDGHPVASLTWQREPGRIMLGSAYTATEHRERGLLSELLRDVRTSGLPVDAYVWENARLCEKLTGRPPGRPRRDRARSA
jgi:hypothetical protein